MKNRDEETKGRDHTAVNTNAGIERRLASTLRDWLLAFILASIDVDFAIGHRILRFHVFFFFCALKTHLSLFFTRIFTVLNLKSLICAQHSFDELN